MGKKYLVFETGQEDLTLYLPTTDRSSLTFARYGYDDFDTYVEALATAYHIDITTGTYLYGCPNARQDAKDKASAINSTTFSGTVEAGDEWTCGELKGTWTGSSNQKICNFYYPGDSTLIFSLSIDYGVRDYVYFSGICVYDETDDKLISLRGLSGNFIAAWNTPQYYKFYTLSGSTTYSITDQESILLNEHVTIHDETEPEPDPYIPSGGPSGPGGGPAGAGGTGTTGTGGLHDDSSDAIPTPSLPSTISLASGLITAYNPSISDLQSFASALWTTTPTDFNDLFRILFGGDAFNAIIGLHLIPVAPDVLTTKNIKLGNWDSGVGANVIANQYKQVNFGSLLLSEYWGNSIDYSPYTKVQLALPYIGIVDVDTDDVLGSTNTLTYNIDVLSGAICATLKCEKFNLNSVIYQWSGSCAVQIPITGANYNSVLSSMLAVAGTAIGIGAFASSGLGAALPALAVGAGGFGAVSGSAANMFGSMKGRVQKSSGFSANSGALGIMTPYFIITRPVQSVPETWQADKGYPANISAQLGTLLGYTEVSEINLVGISGTEEEKNEIIVLLKKGVIF